MSRYIDADKLIESFKDYPFGDTITLTGAIDIIDGFAETSNVADVAPVKHGEWMGTVCTACGESTSFYYDCHYCPQCGAKMD